jgi:hypothetical protein
MLRIAYPSGTMSGPDWDPAKTANPQTPASPLT